MVPPRPHLFHGRSSVQHSVHITTAQLSPLVKLHVCMYTKGTLSSLVEFYVLNFNISDEIKLMLYSSTQDYLVPGAL